MARRVVSNIVGCVIGLAIVLVAVRLGAVAMGVVFAASIAQLLYCRVFAADRIRKTYWHMVDPSAGPPTGAEPVESDIVRRFVAAREWKQIAPLLAEDLARPRLGPLLHTTTWTRYVLTPGHEQVKELQLAGVLSVA